MFLYDLVSSMWLHPLALRTFWSDMTSPAIVSLALTSIEGIGELLGAHGGRRVAGASVELPRGEPDSDPNPANGLASLEGDIGLCQNDMTAYARHLSLPGFPEVSEQSTMCASNGGNDITEKVDRARAAKLSSEIPTRAAQDTATR
jgi:hypothetical protein